MFDSFDKKDYTELDQLVMRYIQMNLDKVAYMRVRELADAIHVAPATVLRFTKKAGFDSFPELRLAIKQELKKRKKLLEQGYSDRSLLPENVFTDDFEEKINQIVEKIAQASLILCVGMGTSGIMAEYAAKQLTTIGYRCFASTAPYLPGLSQREEQHPKDVTLIFSVSGETIEIVQSAKLLKKSHNFVVSITNQSANPLAKVTDMNLSYDTSYNRIHYNMDISSQLPVMFIIETLIKKLYGKHAANSLEKD